MPFFPAGILQDVQNIMNSSLTDTATIARTHATLPCRINSFTRPARIEGLPELARVRQWQITFQNGADVQGADVATIRGNDYTINEISQGDTNSVSTMTFAFRADAIDDFCNATVTFRQNGTNEEVPNIKVVIEPLSLQEMFDPQGTAFMYSVLYPKSMKFTDGTTPGGGDFIVWDGLRTGFTELHYPRHGVLVPWNRALIADN